MKGKEMKPVVGTLLLAIALLVFICSVVSSGTTNANPAEFEDSFTVEEIVMDQEEGLITWNLELSKATSDNENSRQLLLGLPAGFALESIIDKTTGEKLPVSASGYYLVGEDSQEGGSYQIQVITSLPTLSGEQKFSFYPEIQETTRGLNTELTLEESDLNVSSSADITAIGSEETNSVILDFGESIIPQTLSDNISPQAATTVTSWSDLKTEVENTAGADVIYIGDLAENSTGIINVSREVTIISTDATNSLNPTTNKRFVLNQGADLTLQDFRVSGSNNVYFITDNSSSGATITFKNLLMTRDNPDVGLVNGQLKGTVVNVYASDLKSRRSTYNTDVSSINEVGTVAFRGTEKTTLRASNLANGFIRVSNQVFFEDGATVDAVQDTNASVSGDSKAYDASDSNIAYINLAVGANVVFDGAANIMLENGSIPTLTNDNRSPYFMAFLQSRSTSTANTGFTVSQTDSTKSVNLNLKRGVFIRGNTTSLSLDKVNFMFKTDSSTTISSNNASGDNDYLMKAMPLARFLQVQNVNLTNSVFRSSEAGYSFAFYFTVQSYSNLNITNTTIDLDGTKSSVETMYSSIPSMIHFYGNEDKINNYAKSYDNRSSNLIIDNSSVNLKGVSYNNQKIGTTNLFRTGLVLHEHSNHRWNETSGWVNSKFEVKNSSTFSIYNDETTALACRGTGTEFNISGGSTMDVTGGAALPPGISSAGETVVNHAHGMMSAVRLFGETSFSIAKGGYKFDIKEASTFKATKLAGTRQSAVIRVGGASNSINVTGNSVFDVYNAGNEGKTANNPDGKGDYIGVQFDNITNDGAASFNVGTNGSKDNSKVNIVSESGMGVYGGRDTASSNRLPRLNVFAYWDSEFIVRGNTPTGNSGIFGLRKDDSNVNPTFYFYMSRARYYEFENFNTSGNIVYATNNDSRFIVQDAFTMLWKNTPEIGATEPVSHSDDPSINLGRINYTLSGGSFTNSTIPSFSGGLNQYSYLKAIGAFSVKVDKFYQATNADDTIYAQVVAPVRTTDGDPTFDSNNQVIYRSLADSSDGTIGLFIEYTDVDGNVVQDFATTSSLVDVWGDSSSEANIAFNVKGKIKAGTEVKIVGSWDAYSYKEADYPNRMTPPTAADFNTTDYGLYTMASASVSDTQTIVDIIAPTVTVNLNTDKGLDSAVLSGTSDAHSKVYLMLKEKGKDVTTSFNSFTAVNVASDGNWSTTLDLRNISKVYAYGVDATNSISTAQISNIPNGLPTGRVLGLDNQAIHGTWDGNEANITIDAFLNLNEAEASGENSVTYHDAVLPKAAYVSVQDENRQPTLQIREDAAGVLADTLELGVVFNKPVTFNLNGGDIDSNDYVKQLVIKHGTTTVVTKDYDNSTNKWDETNDNQITLTAKELIDAKVYENYQAGNKELKAYIISTDGNASGTGNFENQTSNEVTLTLKIDGILALKSYPGTIDFGDLTITGKDFNEGVKGESLDRPLVVVDTRTDKGNGWQLTATLTKEMENEAGNKLPSALRYFVTGEQEPTTLALKNDVIIYSSQTEEKVNISSSWAETETDPGLKFIADSAIRGGTYTGVVTWTVQVVPDP